MNRLKDLRLDKDLLQKDLAEKLNMKQQQYSRYETNKNDIPTSILIELAFFYNTSIDYLLGLTNQKLPYPRTKLEHKKKTLS